MSDRRIRIGLASLVLAIIMAAAFYCVTTAAQGLPTLNITLTNSGIQVSPKEPMGDRDYAVVIKNDTGGRRGIEMTGVDKGGSAFVRYSKVVARGKTQAFRFYFPSDQTVMIRDIMKCERASRTCLIVNFGNLKTAVRFQ